MWLAHDLLQVWRGCRTPRQYLMRANFRGCHVRQGLKPPALHLLQIMFNTIIYTYTYISSNHNKDPTLLVKGCWAVHH